MSDKKFISLDDCRDDLNNLSFHFTSPNNMTSILQNGFQPQIGDNSSGALGSAAIPKTYLSHSLVGALQLFDTLVIMSFTRPIIAFTADDYKPYLPKSAEGKEMNDTLSIIEGFEMIRQYMENKIYFIIEAPIAKYENELSIEDLREIDSYFGEDRAKYVEIMTRIQSLYLEDKAENQEELARLIKARNELSINMRRKTLPVIEAKRGRMINSAENPIIDIIDYQDERPMWEIQEPHNMHTRIIGVDEPRGCSINPDSIRVFSDDYVTPGNGIEFLKRALENVSEKDILYIPLSYDVFPIFNEYLDLIEKYRALNLLIPQSDNQESMAGNIIDLNNIEKYPGLEEFIKKAEEYHETHRFKAPVRKPHRKADSTITRRVENELNEDEEKTEERNKND